MEWMVFAVLMFILIAGLYLRHANNVLLYQPPDALAFSPRRWTVADIKTAYEKHRNTPISLDGVLPPKTGHRYIIVGGSGFVGGWIVLHLLQRGEHPSHIRILDIRPPTRPDLLTGPASQVEFIRVDVTKANEVDAAFAKPWSFVSNETPLTVFHTAALIRFFERTKVTLPLSTPVNFDGVQNVLNTACRFDTSYFIFTSSASILSKNASCWVLPWKSSLKDHLQVLNDTTPPGVTRDECFSNYVFTKAKADRLVRAFDKNLTSSGSRIRTGCIRPGNLIYGSGGDPALELYLRRKVTPSWVHHVLQTHVYVENVSLSHLLYEQRLIEITTRPGSAQVDIGGQAFLVTDPNPPITYGDIYVALNYLTDGVTQFPKYSPLLVLILSYAIEAYHSTQYFLSTSFPSALSSLLPPLVTPILNLQPSIFSASSFHLVFDDSRARLPAASGGLGYNPPFTSLDGVCKLVHMFIEQSSGALKEAEIPSQAGIVGAEIGAAQIVGKMGRIAENGKLGR